VQFPLYEQLKHWARKFAFLCALPLLMCYIESRRSDEPLPNMSIVMCTAASKMVASVATYPHEVIRTRLQTQKLLIRRKHNSPTSGFSTSPSSTFATSSHSHTPGKYLGVIQTTRVILREETWRGLYKGLSINLFRTVPNSVVTMLT
jgi:solute carrier family 25 (mitochondrial folate transporter), member 32